MSEDTDSAVRAWAETQRLVLGARDEARLAYVAVTRASSLLDLSGLGWIRNHPDGTVAIEHLLEAALDYLPRVVLDTIGQAS